MSYQLQGQALLASGAIAERTAVLDWQTLALVAVVVPDSDGQWALTVPRPGPYCVLSTGPSGYQPAADGPVTAIEG